MRFARAKKKVILIDLDIRKGTLSSKLKKERKGITNYLANPSITVDDIIQKDSNHENLDIITL